MGPRPLLRKLAGLFLEVKLSCEVLFAHPHEVSMDHEATFLEDVPTTCYSSM